MTATRAELDMLRAQEREYKPTMQLTPGGGLEYSVNQDVEFQRQQRINELNQKLYGDLQKIRQERAVKASEGYAQTQFNAQNP